MNLHNEIMNIPTRVGTYNDEYCYKLGHRDARHHAAELALKAQTRIEELEQSLQKLYLASGPVSNCAYNVGQHHEDWENIHHYVSELDKARTEAIRVFRGEK